MNEAIKKALVELRNGGVILYPTDTFWGIGCDATNEAAIKRLCEIKRCDKLSDFTILLDNTVKLDRYVEEVPELAFDLIDMSDKPLTIIFEGVKGLAENVCSEDNIIGIRITAESFSKRLIERHRKPLIHTTASICGGEKPLFFSDISEEIKAAVDYVVDYTTQDEKAIIESIVSLGNDASIKVIRE